MPDKVLVESLCLLSLPLDHASQISPVGILHDDVEGAGLGVEEGVVVGDNIGGVDAGQETDLVKSGILLLLIKIGHFDNLDGEEPFILGFRLHLDDPSEGATSKLLNQLVSFHRRIL
mgnify:CR=1 FL=1